MSRTETGRVEEKLTQENGKQSNRVGTKLKQDIITGTTAK